MPWQPSTAQAHALKEHVCLLPFSKPPFKKYMYLNTCRMPHLTMSPKCFTMATAVLPSASEQTHWALVICNLQWVTAALQWLKSNRVVCLLCCLVVTWLVPCETAAILVLVLCTPDNHAPVYSVNLSKSHMYAYIYTKFVHVASLCLQW